MPKTARMLDAGCATGYLLGLLHGLGYTRLTGVDVSVQLTATARERLPPEVSIHCADLFDFLRATPDGSFDVILFHHVIEHIPRERIVGLLREFHRCLAPGGWLNVKTPNAANLLAGHYVAGDITHVTPFNELSLRQVAELAGFPADTFEVVRNPPRLFWSWRHPGRAALRVFNRLRWHANRGVHRAVAMLVDVHPALECADWELDALLKKPAVLPAAANRP
ncbi:MAG: class I SAM-dependent methyltransferase [Thiomonas sp.]